MRLLRIYRNCKSDRARYSWRIDNSVSSINLIFDVYTYHFLSKYTIFVQFEQRSLKNFALNMNFVSLYLIKLVIREIKKYFRNCNFNFC